MKTSLIIVFAFLFLIAAELAWKGWRDSRGAPGAERFLAAFLPISGLVFLQLVSLRILNAPTLDWNARRLVGPMAVGLGLGVDFSPVTGPLVSGVYGPMQLLAFAPAALAALPSQALYLGSALSGLFFFLPALWAHLETGRRGKGDFTVAAASFLVFGLFALEFPCLELSASMIHGDAPALGLAMAACFSILSKRIPERLAPWVSSACAVLSLFSKLTVAPLFVAIPAYLFLAAGWRPAVRYLGCLAVSFAALFLCGAALFGWDLYLVSWILPFDQLEVASLTSEGAAVKRGWGELLKPVMRAFNELLQAYYPPLVIVLAWICYAPPPLSSRRALGAWLEERPWILPLVTGFLLLPPSLLGRVKGGGELNNQSPAVYFFLIASTLLLARTFAAARTTATRRIATSAVAALVIVGCVLQLPLYHELTWPLETAWGREHDEAYRFAKAHPGAAYFPDHPLSTLMAEGKIYHSRTAVGELAPTRHRLTPERFLAHVPAAPEYIVTRDARPGQIEALFPGFTPRTGLDDLPGWLVYRR